MHQYTNWVVFICLLLKFQFTQEQAAGAHEVICGQVSIIDLKRKITTGIKQCCGDSGNSVVMLDY